MSDGLIWVATFLLRFEHFRCRYSYKLVRCRCRCWYRSCRCLYIEFSNARSQHSAMVWYEYLIIMIPYTKCGYADCHLCLRPCYLVPCQYSKRVFTAIVYWQSSNAKMSAISRYNIALLTCLGQYIWSYRQGTLKGENITVHWPPVWLVWNQLFDNYQFSFLFAKQINPNQSNRRSMVTNIFFFQLLRSCVKEFSRVGTLFGELLETSFDADEATLAQLQVSSDKLYRFMNKIIYLSRKDILCFIRLPPAS